MLKIKVHYGISSFNFKGNIVIKRSTKEKEWEEFGHEIGHHFRHVGNQTTMHRLFVELQENQANHFSYLFCVPSFMLDQLPNVNADIITRTFPVSKNFAERRLHLYENSQLERRAF